MEHWTGGEQQKKGGPQRTTTRGAADKARTDRYRVPAAVRGTKNRKLKV
jgi:hypothetical protein